MSVGDLIDTGSKRGFIVPPVFIPALEKNHRRNLKSVPDGPTSQSLYLYGPTGSGKTTIAYSLGLEVLRKDLMDGPKQRPLAISVLELLEQLRAAMLRQRNQVDIPILPVERYKGTKWLLLDDFGPENATDWVFSQLYLILNHRYEWNLTTIITSNLSISELEDKLEDSRIPSRIRSMCVPVKIDGPDLRLK